MFVTFSATMTDNDLVWYYSRIYLYVFNSLFIYAVLNLFLAVINDTYMTIKVSTSILLILNILGKIETDESLKYFSCFLLGVFSRK